MTLTITFALTLTLTLTLTVTLDLTLDLPLTLVLGTPSRNAGLKWDGRYKVHESLCEGHFAASVAYLKAFDGVNVLDFTEH